MNKLILVAVIVGVVALLAVGMIGFGSQKANASNTETGKTTLSCGCGADCACGCQGKCTAGSDCGCLSGKGCGATTGGSCGCGKAG
jgi:hypothetical protein